MSTNPLVSIIIPVYNVEKYIEETVRSVIGQTYLNWELILIDDGSSDQTYQILQDFTDERIKIYQNDKNRGPSYTRNRGLSLAKGEYIAFLDSDDLWEKEKLSKQLNFMQKNHHSFTFTSYKLVDEQGQDIHRVVHVPEKVNYQELLCNTVISTITVMFESKLKQYLQMPENIENGEDFSAWLNVLKHIPYAYGLDCVLSSYRQVSSSLSHDRGMGNRLKRVWYVYRKIEKISYTRSLMFLLKYSFNTLKKRTSS